MHRVAVLALVLLAAALAQGPSKQLQLSAAQRLDLRNLEAESAAKAAATLANLAEATKRFNANLLAEPPTRSSIRRPAAGCRTSLRPSSNTAKTASGPRLKSSRWNTGGHWPRNSKSRTRRVPSTSSSPRCSATRRSDAKRSDVSARLPTRQTWRSALQAASLPYTRRRTRAEFLLPKAMQLATACSICTFRPV